MILINLAWKEGSTYPQPCLIWLETFWASLCVFLYQKTQLYSTSGSMCHRGWLTQQGLEVARGTRVRKSRELPGAPGKCWIQYNSHQCNTPLRST
jgi:hypothetical protein